MSDNKKYAVTCSECGKEYEDWLEPLPMLPTICPSCYTKHRLKDQRVRIPGGLFDILKEVYEMDNKCSCFPLSEYVTEILREYCKERFADEQMTRDLEMEHERKTSDAVKRRAAMYDNAPLHLEPDHLKYIEYT